MKRKTVANLFGALLGISLLVALGFVLSGWFRTMRTAREGAPVSSQSQPVSALRESEEQILPVPQSQEQAGSTAGWKMYSNSKYGFSIKYPPEWTIHEDEDSGLGFSFQSPDLQTDWLGKVRTGAYVRVTIISNPASIPIQDWVAQNLNPPGVKRLSEPTTADIAGHSAVRYEEDIDLWGETYVAIVAGDAKLFRFDLFYSESSRPAAMNVLEGMLANLRFSPNQ